MIHIYVVNNHGAELKEKAPPSIWLCYVLAFGIAADIISGYTAHIKLWHHVTMHFN